MSTALSIPDGRERSCSSAAGERVSFDGLVRLHQARLHRQALQLCRDPDTAEDLVQETCIEAWKSLRRYNGRCQFSTWLYAILLHRYKKYLRYISLRPSVSGMPDAPESAPGQGCADAAVAALEREGRERLRLRVDGLPAIHRDVILLRFFADASLNEIAGVLNCSVGTVKSRLHHALEKLRKLDHV